MERKSPIFCNHANESPACCTCGPDCYCKDHSCKSFARKTIEDVRNKNVVAIDMGDPKNCQFVPGTEAVFSDGLKSCNIEEPISMYEEAIAQVREWLGDIYPASKIDRALKIEYLDVGDPVPKLMMRARIWTMNNIYTISVSMHVDHPPGYIGGGAMSRKCRTGETWQRGNDLADGKFNEFRESTWNRIMRDIVRYEAEEVKSEKWKETNVIH